MRTCAGEVGFGKRRIMSIRLAVEEMLTERITDAYSGAGDIRVKVTLMPEWLRVSFPLNWSALYRPAFERIADRFRLQISDVEYEHITSTLTKYNTRINSREAEVSSDTIFEEIIKGTDLPMDLLEDIKNEFYMFFRNDVVIYDEVRDILKRLKDKGIVTGTLSDVAYGMDNRYALEDISAVIDYIDFPYTSNDVGYRKPSSKGLILLSEKMGVPVFEMAFVGDEKKDIECAKNAGVTAVLINRSDEEREYGQDYTIRRLDELFALIDH